MTGEPGEPDAPSAAAWLGDPIDARPLFGTELGSLLSILRGLEPADWHRPATGIWTVHDVVAHLLGDFRGRLGCDHRGGPADGETIAAFIHRTNQEWVELHAGDSPASLVEALADAGTRLSRRFAAADLYADALGVSWAGADPAPAWLDIAREFTEHWTHRQQIRHAVGHPTDPEPRALATVLDTFLRALPHTLRGTEAPPGTQVRVIVEGPAGGTWTATATESAGVQRWTLAQPSTRSGPPTAVLRLDAETAWRAATRLLHPTETLARAHVCGDHHLAEAVCRLVSIVY
ncbi:maleylpyruvate isomerase family mycothiol-dependent enzyme [Phaeacidiphilus oryzae]|uniref:maleylpyruvate isomerase family mycothiol-dependent enzyme n=1 Tax=Phaeacidiphilus oryzae TaxID=348818 RepID=UPI00055B3519|nr:maleylpyruvate isomerase family mycothiol-dependent enzyme [Phaeacidiphilus oryzae]